MSGGFRGSADACKPGLPLQHLVLFVSRRNDHLLLIRDPFSRRGRAHESTNQVRKNGRAGQIGERSTINDDRVSKSNFIQRQEKKREKKREKKERKEKEKERTLPASVSHSRRRPIYRGPCRP